MKSMDIRILQLVEGAKQARGLAVIIDVFRAFSVACYVFANGAKKIIPVEDIDTAYRLKRENCRYILMGERGGKRPRGFDFGNSPTQIEHVDFTEKVVIHTTSGGTRGLLNAGDADEIITGSFVNAEAVVKYIKEKQPGIVSLICMGDAGERETDEDTLCAEYVRDRLEGKKTDFEWITGHLRNYETAKKFFDAQKEWAPERDFELCLECSRFDFILRVEPYGEDLLQLRMHRSTADSK
jgi:2-phosphosulfolactate phosphatase